MEHWGQGSPVTVSSGESGLCSGVSLGDRGTQVCPARCYVWSPMKDRRRVPYCKGEASGGTLCYWYLEHWGQGTLLTVSPGECPLPIPWDLWPWAGTPAICCRLGPRQFMSEGDQGLCPCVIFLIPGARAPWSPSPQVRRLPFCLPVLGLGKQFSVSRVYVGPLGVPRGRCQRRLVLHSVASLSPPFWARALALAGGGQGDCTSGDTNS